jgi:hypothetical protein
VEHLRDKRTRSASIISKDTSLVEEIQNKKWKEKKIIIFC